MLYKTSYMNNIQFYKKKTLDWFRRINNLNDIFTNISIRRRDKKIIVINFLKYYYRIH